MTNNTQHTREYYVNSINRYKSSDVYWLKMQRVVTYEKSQNIAMTYYNIHYTKCEKKNIKMKQVWCCNK